MRALRRFKATAESLGAAMSQKQKPTIQEERRTIPCMQSLPGFSGDKLPVRIARGEVASKCPDVRNVGHALGVAINDIAILVARYSDELGLEPHGHLRVTPAQFGRGNIRVVDGHEPALHRFTALLAFTDGTLKAVINFACEQILQRATVAFGEGVDNHLLGNVTIFSAAGRTGSRAE